jgi:hypothetical protein
MDLQDYATKILQKINFQSDALLREVQVEASVVPAVDDQEGEIVAVIPGTTKIILYYSKD